MKLEHISIRGLFGHVDVNIPIRDNTLIVVGANGLGKSTVLNIVYLFLSKRWHQLSQKPFEEIELSFEKHRTGLRRDQLAQSSLILKPAWLPPFDFNFYRGESQLTVAKLLSYPLSFLRELRHSKSTLSRTSALLIPPSEQREIHSFLTADVNRPAVVELFDGPLTHVLETLDLFAQDRLMFLPTYRRIEHDLSTLLPDADEVIANYQRSQKKYARRSVTEFVQFGMDDVKQLFEVTQQDIRSGSHVAISSTSASYLQDVIRGKGREYDPTQIKALDDATIVKTMSRYRAAPLKRDDQQRLLAVTKRIRDDVELTENDSLIAHYLIKLIEAMARISAHEAPVRRFADTVNSYLSGKSVRYDEETLSLSIIDERSERVELKDLSSGEKQIVSLFAHIFLEDTQNLIFIDEPELSLSVNWQLKFLPDIRRSDKCNFLMAVTHSPFIFENDLEPYAMDLRIAQSPSAYHE